MFSILGPQAPFASHPPVIEAQVEFIGQVLRQALESGAERVEATEEATQGWSDTCDMILEATLLPQGMGDRPWFLGANVPGKKPSTLCYLGGMAGYGAEVAKEIESGFPGFRFSGR
jgi:cyclohexanone monooxygenase